MPNVFVDTNIFIYAFDNSAPEKREIARNAVSSLDDSIVTSTQVLQEFYWNATKKLKMAPSEAKRTVEQISRRKVVQVSPILVLNSIDTSDRYRLSFWNALILEAAAQAGCNSLLSEDLSHGQIIRGIKVTNPFA